MTSNPVVLEDKPVPPVPPVDAILDKLLSRITKPEIVSTNLKVLIYGSPGTGKTTFAATAPSPLVIDVERGSRTLVGLREVEVLEYVSIEQVEKVVDYLVNNHAAFSKYETIVFDSLSEMQRRLLDQQLGNMSKTIGSPLYKADWGVYGENTQRLRSLMSRFRDIPKNLVVTAQDKVEKDDATGIMMARPDLTPKLSATVAGLFDVVGYLRINSKGERILQVQPTKTVLAKTRITSLPKEIINPTWHLINK